MTASRRLLPLLLASAVLAALLLAWSGGGASSAPPSAVAQERGAFDVLVFSRTQTFRHASIPVGIQMIRDLGREHGFRVEATEDPKAFFRAYLARFEAIIFLNTTGDVLSPRRQRVLERYVKRGGGFVGIHSAADTEHDWRWYRRLVGAHFLSHPLEQTGTLVNEAPDHPATAHLPARFTTFDEFYSFKQNPRRRVRVLLSIDESTYDQDPNTTNLPGGGPVRSGVMGDHPMAWCHDRLGGRSFYTALGHEVNQYADPRFRRHVYAGILTATRQIRARCTRTRGGPRRG